MTRRTAHPAWQITVVVENTAPPPFTGEHGLALHCRHRASGCTLLFDTGAGGALLPNLTQLDIPVETIREVVLSHGHNDHTGGMVHLPGRTFFHAPGISAPHYSCHTGKPPRNISMTAAAQQLLTAAVSSPVDAPREIMPQVWLTGAIPRISGEDTGGPFFTAATADTVDTIADEQAMILAEDAVLIQGCCHAGIINTLEFCRKQLPEVRIETVIGGLHLLFASEERLQLTAGYLREYGIRNLHLMHCTGADAIARLQELLPEMTITIPVTGDIIT